MPNTSATHAAFQDADILWRLRDQVTRLRGAAQQFQLLARRRAPMPLASPVRGKGLEQERRRQLLAAADLLLEAAARIEARAGRPPESNHA